MASKNTISNLESSAQNIAFSYKDYIRMDIARIFSNKTHHSIVDLIKINFKNELWNSQSGSLTESSKVRRNEKFMDPNKPNVQEYYKYFDQIKKSENNILNGPLSLKALIEISQKLNVFSKD